MKGLFIISLLCTTVHTGRASPLPDIFLISLIALLLLVATVTTLWEILKKESPDQAKALDFFLIFAVVVVPFIMVIYFGLPVVVYEATAALQSGWPRWSLNVPWQIQVGLVAVYFVVTTWLWFRWAKER
jgi:hypothetical protein